MQHLQATGKIVLRTVNWYAKSWPIYGTLLLGFYSLGTGIFYCSLNPGFHHKFYLGPHLLLAVMHVYFMDLFRINEV